MKNFTKTDRVILLLAAVVLAVFSYFLYDDSLLFPRPESKDLQKIGQVAFSSNDVRLKTMTAFTWFPAQKTDSVHLQDSVFTGENSEARLQLEDGTVLTLKPNSLITLNMNDGQMSLDLRYGDLSSKLSGKGALKITAGDKTFDLEGAGSVDINKPSAGEVGVQVTEGSAKLKGAHGVETLEKGRKLNLGKKGAKPKFAEPPVATTIEAVTADGAGFVRLAEDEPIPLEWKTTGPVSSYEVDLCADAECRSPLKTLSTRETRFGVRGELKDGPTLWRVRAIDKYGKDLAKTAPRTVNVGQAVPPVITTPGGDDAKLEGAVKIHKPGDPVQGQLQLSWTEANYYGKYELEIATDPEFTQPVHQAQTEQGGLQTPGLPNGLYHYRVRGELRNGRPSGWSQPSKFLVDLKGELPQRPARPVLKEKNIVFNPAEEMKREPASAAKPVVAWTKVKNAVSYLIQLSKDPDFKDPVAYNVKSESIAWSDYKPGEWNVRVFATNADGLKSPPSQPGKLRIALTDPVLNPIAPIKVHGTKELRTPPEREFKARWTEIPFADSYVLEVSTTKNFAAPVKLQTRAPASAVKVSEPGSYYFRVQALDAEGNPLTKISATKETEYEWVNPATAPVLTEPFDKASIFLQTTQEPFIWLEWKRSEDADFYQIQVATDKDFKNKIVSEKLFETKYLLQQKIPTGKIYWRVRSVIEKSRQVSDWSNPRHFQIFSNKNEAFIE